MKLRRTIVSDPDFDGQTRYRHPNGWVIKKCKRDWSLGSITRGAAHQYQPMYWWEVRRSGSGGWRESPRHEADTLREAAAWCDQHRPKEEQHG